MYDILTVKKIMNRKKKLKENQNQNNLKIF